MNIIKKSRENLDKKDLYFMATDSNIKKLSELANKTVKVIDYIIYTDVNNTEPDKEYKVISIKTDAGCYASNSPTFIDCFEKIIECFGEDFSQISITTQRSNKGRNFLICSYVA